MSAAVAPIGTYRYEKAEGDSSSMADQLCEDEKFTPETEALMNKVEKKFFIVLYTDREQVSRVAYVLAPNRTDAEAKLSKAKGQLMVTFSEAKAELLITTERKERIAQLEKNPDAEVRYASFPPPNHFHRLGRKSEILVLTQEEYELSQAS